VRLKSRRFVADRFEKSQRSLRKGEIQMAITGFGKGRDTEPGTQARPSTAPASSSPGGLTAFIDQGSEFEGKLSFRDTVRIDGRFSGEIASENTLIVGESGEIEATIRSNTVAISGRVTGNVIAQKKVMLHKSAVVDGNIETPSLVVEDGAVINGTLKMTSGEAKKSTAPLKAVGSEKAAGPPDSHDSKSPKA
jgi:cytoskeletal protein CcmA (bactofilin family)